MPKPNLFDLNHVLRLWENAKRKVVKIIDEGIDIDDAEELVMEIIHETFGLARITRTHLIVFWSYVMGHADTPPIFGGYHEGHSDEEQNEEEADREGALSRR